MFKTMVLGSVFVRIIRACNMPSQLIKRHCGKVVSNHAEYEILSSNKYEDDVDFESEIKALKQVEKESILAPCNEDISHIAPYFRPTFNFAAYINESETLKKLVELDVDLYKIEKKKSAPELILKLDFEKDIKPRLFFLHDVGVSADQLPHFITKNPFIFEEAIDTLTVRINYLESKKFDKSMIARIVTNNPYWLMHSTTQIDKRLGYFQRTFTLTGNEIRHLSTKQPKLITYKMAHIKLNTFAVKEEMGFNDNEMKHLLLEVPRIWMMNQDSLIKRFEYIHNTMKISHEQILKMPKVFTSRRFRIEQRHRFLTKLGRAQYDPEKENYVPLETLIQGSDADFCVNVAKSSVQAYNLFLKTL